MDDLRQVDARALQPIDPADFVRPGDPDHAPRILILHGSLRDVSYSRALGDEAERLLSWFGCAVRRFDPAGLPLADTAHEGGPERHPKVTELRDLATWSEGMMWVSPERHGAITGAMKTQIDWIPLSMGGVRPTQGKTLALAQVSGGSQSFNTLNQMRILGRWMRMVTIPNQSSVPKAWNEFETTGGVTRMKPSPFHDRLVDVCEELVRFTWLTRGRSAALLDRYSERKESREALSKRVNQPSL